MEKELGEYEEMMGGPGNGAGTIDRLEIKVTEFE